MTIHSPNFTPSTGTLYLVSGKIAAGKSTLTTKLGMLPNTIILREDQWLSLLFPNELRTVKDYTNYSARLREAVTPHVVQLLKSGLSVVLDFPANTRETRVWMRSLFEAARAPHTLYYLDVPDEICMSRLKKRNTAGKHEFTVSETQFAEISSYFEKPDRAEGLNVIPC